MALTEIIVDSQAYEVICKTETEVQKFSLYAVPSDVAYKELQRFSQFIYDNYANKLLGTPITIDGVPYDSIQTVLTALAANGTNDVVAGSAKWLTSGGAYKDKTSSVAEGSKKVITAHGAHQDKTNSVQEGSTKNLTALGAYFHKYFNVPYNASDTDTRVMTAKGMFADKRSTATADSMRNFTSGGAWDYFAGSKTFEIWLGKVFGTQLTNAWGRVSTIRTNDFAGRAEGKGSDTVIVAATASGMYYSTNSRSFAETDSGAVNFTCCHYANGIFVAGSDTNGLYWSEDGRAWHQATGIFDNPENSIYEVQYTPEVYTVDYLGGKWLAGCHGASGSNSRYALLISDDGKTWSSGAIQEDRTVKTMAYGEYTINGTAYKYWLIGGDYILRYSSDLVSWSGNLTGGYTKSKIIFVPRFKKFIITTPEPNSSDTAIWYFDTILHTDTEGIPAALGVNDVHYGYTKCVAATKEGIYWSADGVNWAQSENATTGEYNKVFYANGMWLAGTVGGTYIRNSSNNGINWHEVYNMTLEPTVIKHFNGTWLLGTANGAWHSDFVDLGYVYA